MSWPVFDAKARFNELLETTLSEGPQIVTRRGVETAVLLSIHEWKKLQSSARRPIVDPLLDQSAPRDLFIPARRTLKARVLSNSSEHE